MFCSLILLLVGTQLSLALKEPRVRNIPGLRILLPNRLEQGAQLEVPLSSINKRGNPLRRLRVFNEEGEYLAEVLKTDSAENKATLLLRELLRAPRQGGGERHAAPLKLLLVPQKKDQRFRNLIESCTQVGVSEFVLVDSAKAGKQSNAGCVDDEVVKSWIQSSVEQCERIHVPSINRSNKGVVDVVKEASGGCRKRYFVAVEPRFTSGAGELKARSLLEELQECDKGGERSGERQDYLVIGPEGGWEAAELTSLLAAGDGKHTEVRPVTLGDGVLRSETAAVVGSGVYNCWLGPQEDIEEFAMEGEAEGEGGKDGGAKGVVAEKLAEIKELVKENGIAGLVALLIEVVAFNLFILLPATLFLFHQRIGLWLPTPATTAEFWKAFGATYIFCKFPPIEAARFAFAFRIIPWVADRLPEDVKSLDIEDVLRETFKMDGSDPAASVGKEKRREEEVKKDKEEKELELDAHLKAGTAVEDMVSRIVAKPTPEGVGEKEKEKEEKEETVDV